MSVLITWSGERIAKNFVPLPRGAWEKFCGRLCFGDWHTHVDLLLSLTAGRRLRGRCPGLWGIYAGGFRMRALPAPELLLPIGGEDMGRPRKFKTPKALANNWDAYKDWCDSQEVLAHAFSAKNSEFVSEGLKRKITYTIEGFCVWAGISRSVFGHRYAHEGGMRGGCPQEV